LYIIYGLFDPRDGRLRSIGKSASGLKRPKAHAILARNGKDQSYKGRWIRQLQSFGLTYTIEVLEQHDCPEDLADAERWNIQHYRSISCDLTNLTDGGEGTTGRVVSEESRKKHSRSMKGRSKSPEHRQKISATLKGRPLRAETRARMSAARRGRALSGEHRAAILRGTGARPICDQFGTVYHSIAAATRALRVGSGSVYEVVQGVRRHSVHGFTFTYH